METFVAKFCEREILVQEVVVGITTQASVKRPSIMKTLSVFPPAVVDFSGLSIIVFDCKNEPLTSSKNLLASK